MRKKIRINLGAKAVCIINDNQLFERENIMGRHAFFLKSCDKKLLHHGSILKQSVHNV